MSHFEKSVTECRRVPGSQEKWEGKAYTLEQLKSRNQDTQKTGPSLPLPPHILNIHHHPRTDHRRAVFLVPQTELIYSGSPILYDTNKAGGVSGELLTNA